MKASKKPLVDSDGEVREITIDDLQYATRGRPSISPEARKKRVNLMLDPDVITRLKTKGNMSAEVNQLLRDHLNL